VVLTVKGDNIEQRDLFGGKKKAHVPSLDDLLMIYEKNGLMTGMNQRKIKKSFMKKEKTL